MLAISLRAALATLASTLMLFCHFFPLRLWSVCQPNTLSLDTPVFNVWVFQPAVVSLPSLLADEHQMLVPLSPLLYSRFSHKQYITVILSSSRPPAARPARLPAYPLTLMLLRQDVVSLAVCSQEHFKKEIFSLGGARPSECLVSVTKCLGSSVAWCCRPASI